MQFAWIAVAVANVWAAPGTATIPSDPNAFAGLSYTQRIALVGHMPTQALYGERVLVTGRRGAWVKIAIPDQPSPLDRRGYPGWLLASQLRTTSPPSAVVTVRKSRAGRLEVGLGSEVPPGAATRPLPLTRADLVHTAERFLGLHYLWGGLSAWGYDCSGLTWAVYRTHGITIPRDSEAQFTAGKAVTMARAKPGDLVFYEGVPPGHVAMLIGGGEMIEAPNSASEVRIVPVRSGYVGVRRFVSWR
jgi:cell wall-associated NlpC family hydrolase